LHAAECWLEHRGLFDLCVGDGDDDLCDAARLGEEEAARHVPQRALQQLEDARVHRRLGTGAALQAEHESAHVRDGGAVE